ncbi:MAG: hypothetical protein IKB34_04265 [Clostridia bacterium]|nr:hypothetical protein [Clostridia bacterium]
MEKTITGIEEFLVRIKVEKDFNSKTQMSAYLLKLLESGKVKLKGYDAEAAVQYALSEIDKLILLIREEPTYKKKTGYLNYAENVIGILSLTVRSSGNVTEEDQIKLRELLLLGDSERFLENAISGMFQKERIEREDLLEVLNEVSKIEEEYHRGVLYGGILHFRSGIRKLSDEARILMADYLDGELARYLSKGNALDEDSMGNLEILVDVCRDFITDKTVSQLYEVLKLGNSTVNAYAVDTLVKNGKSVPADVIETLAKQLPVACNVYNSLKTAGLEQLFPEECSTPEYLAKSDLVRWLVYPTELNKEPDEIEYLGCRRVKKDTYYVFRYRSDSDNIGDELKNKWLIGWSSESGGTFSNFDLYEPFVKKTEEKTLKHIVKKLIG